MMGQHDRSEALFYYFRLEDQVPETHLLRLIDRHVSFAFVREQLKDSYSENGRPSIDPELLLRILQKEESFLRPRAFHLRTGTGSLYLPCGPAAKLRRPKSSQSRLDLHRDTQTLWPVRAPTAMHECGFPMPGHPSARTGSATRTGVSEHAGVRPRAAAKEESGSVVCRTEESDRSAPPASAEIEVRTGAVLPGRGGAKP